MLFNIEKYCTSTLFTIKVIHKHVIDDGYCLFGGTVCCKAELFKCYQIVLLFVEIFKILSFSIFSSIFANIFGRDISRILPSCLGAAVLRIGIIWLNLKSSGKHSSLRHLLHNLVRTGTKTTLAILINFGEMLSGPVGAEFVLILSIAQATLFSTISSYIKLCKEAVVKFSRKNSSEILIIILSCVKIKKSKKMTALK